MIRVLGGFTDWKSKGFFVAYVYALYRLMFDLGIFVHQWDLLLKDLIDLQFVRQFRFFWHLAFRHNADLHGHRFSISEEHSTASRYAA